MKVGIKEGASVAGIRPELVLAYTVAMAIYASYDDGDVECIITEATGGHHGVASLHYVGQAIDLRTWGLTGAEQRDITGKLKSSLGSQYDVILESDHIHIEFQPK